MNRNMVYFTQRVLSAATSAAVYVIADMISQQTRQKSYAQNRKPKKSYPKPTNSRKMSYTEYAKKKPYQAHRTDNRPAGTVKHYRSINEQVKERRRKGLK